MNKSLKVLFITCSTDSTFGGWGEYSSNLIRSLRDNGVEVIVCVIEKPLSFKKHFWGGCFKAFKLFFKYRKEKFDLVHCAIEPYAFITAVFSRIKKTKYFITIHGTYALIFLNHGLYKFFQEYAYRNASKIIAVSNYTKSRIDQLVDLDNVVVINNGISYLPKSNGKKQKEKRSPFLIMSIGGLKGRKGYHVVIKALGKIKNKLGSFKYYIVGSEHDPTYVKHLRYLVEENDLRKNVVMTGFISEEEKEEIFKKADVFVLPSISGEIYFEGFGLVYLEASAHGVPVIGSLGTGAEDAIKNGETGFLVPQNDPESLSRSILELSQDNELAQKMSVAGIKWSKDNHWDNIVPQYIKIYTQ